MESKIQNLEWKIKELETEINNLKEETVQALTFISNKFSEELINIMDQYKTELKLETMKIINSYRQH
jgi:uncharacterized Fe-S radical SAM superfamily protein PflX